MLKTFVSTRFVFAIIALIGSAVLCFAGKIDGGHLTAIWIAVTSLFGVTKSIEYLRGRNSEEANEGQQKGEAK